MKRTSKPDVRNKISEELTELYLKEHPLPSTPVYQFYNHYIQKSGRQITDSHIADYIYNFIRDLLNSDYNFISCMWYEDVFGEEEEDRKEKEKREVYYYTVANRE